MRETQGNETIYAIVGPTAVGKTRIGFELAARVGAEIISVDSRQVYRYLDVGTDKISLRERRIVPHHLIDVADPDNVFTVADFVRCAESAIDRIRNRGRVPLLVGGSPLYYKALGDGLMSEGMPFDRDLRRSLEERAKREGNDALFRVLLTEDPESAERIHPNDRVRMIRALEVKALTGRCVGELYREREKIGRGLDIFYFGVNSSRARLYEKIEKRVVEQFHSGYPEEVKWLLDHGYSRDLPALQGFGYRELVAYIGGEMTFQEAIEGDIRATKSFSRRQMTWFKHFSPVLWYDVSGLTFSEILNDMERVLRDGMSVEMKRTNE